MRSLAREDQLRFHSIHWDRTHDSDWAPAPGASFAIWPGPIDGDACFEESGFTDFEDSDDAWDADITALNTALVGALASICGESRLVTAAVPLTRPNLKDWWRSLVRGTAPPQPTHEERLEAATRHDGFPPCILEFGEPPTAAVRTSDGHPLWHVWLGLGSESESLISRVLVVLAQGTPIVQTTLSWAILVRPPRTAG